MTSGYPGTNQETRQERPDKKPSIIFFGLFDNSFFFLYFCSKRNYIRRHAFMKKIYERRKFVIIAIVFAVGLLFIIRLFVLQVWSDTYKLYAENNVLRTVTEYPARGLVYDRNGRLLTYNEAAYDLMIIPRQVTPFDTLELCRLLSIEKEDLVQRLVSTRKYSPYKPSIFLEQISKEDYGYLEEKLFKYPGFYVQARSLRKYPDSIAAHILGYISEVDNRDIERDAYYKMGDYIGKSGIEKKFERILRGRKGQKVKMVDVHNREMGSFQGGKYDTTAVSGRDIYLTIDAGIQSYAEKLMQNKKGGIVAIEPASGEVLAMVSSPSYDPNLLVGRIRAKNFRKLSLDSLEPLFNRATMAQYPPGSTFKTINTLIGLQEGILSSRTAYSCNGPGSWPIPCSHDHRSPLRLPEAIEQSCNPYFWKLFKAIIEQPRFNNIQDAYNNWKDYVLSFGISQVLPGDIADQAKGFLPKDTYFNKYYGMNGWKAITVRSLSIGQGEIQMTPLQLANVAATIANRGYYHPPHLLKSIEGEGGQPEKYSLKITPSVDAEHYNVLIEGMKLVYEGEMGSARWYRMDSIPSCGKTGTAQNPHGENHSVFMAFAPVENPRIAIAVVIENSGYGATWAAPIATLIMEKYLRGRITLTGSEKRMLNADFIHR
jgi:penicillin-binding protein 2